MTALIFAITFLILWKREPERRETLAMGTGYLFLAIGFFMSQLNPDSLGRLNISVTNIPYSIGCIVLIWGILSRADVRPPVWTMIGIAAVGGLLGIVSQVFGDSVEADLYIANTTYGLIFGIAALLLSQNTKNDLIEKIVLSVLVLNVAQFFLRPTLSFMFSDEIAGGAYRDTTYYVVLMMVLALGSMVLGLALIAACIKDQLKAVHDDYAVDRLSGLLSRREFETKVRDAIVEARRKEIPLSLVIGDMDHFKQVNDIWGHQVGDSAIEAFGKLVIRTVRDSDICGRVGGEEFCILVWNADAKAAQGLAERLRIGLTAVNIAGMNDGTHLTASFGTASAKADDTYRKLFARADKALYGAKHAGRNIVATDGVEIEPRARRSNDEPAASGTSAAA
jgi:diguanylate cyclase (GGDEF)-like protein